MNAQAITKLRSAETCFGTWLSLGSPVVAEIAAQCGLDWLLVDLEHGSFNETSVLPILQAIGPRPVGTVVRVPSHDASLIARVLDWGADAIMAPHVSTAEEARAIVQAMRYPPAGIRGYSRTVRAYDYGLTPPRTHGTPLFFAQIESLEGLSNVEEIAAVDGVDVLFVGPADLKVSLDAAPDAPAFEDALARVVTAAQARSIHAGLLIRDARETAKRVEQGFDKIAVNSDMSILREGFLAVKKQ